MIELFDGWKIDADSMSYSLIKESEGKNKKGEDVVRRDVVGYYGSLQSALKALSRELVRDNVKRGSYTLTEALAMVSEVEQSINDALKEIRV